MPFVIDLMENKVFQMRYNRGLEDGMEAGRQAGLEAGRQDGLKMGRQAGLVLGESKILRALLQKRFGPLPNWAEERIEGASPEQIEGWSLAVLDAKNLNEVLGQS